jgi:hypothetical protein
MPPDRRARGEMHRATPLRRGRLRTTVLLCPISFSWFRNLSSQAVLHCLSLMWPTKSHPRDFCLAHPVDCFCSVRSMISRSAMACSSRSPEALRASACRVIGKNCRRHRRKKSGLPWETDGHYSRSLVLPLLPFGEGGPCSRWKSDTVPQGRAWVESEERIYAGPVYSGGINRFTDC